MFYLYCWVFPEKHGGLQRKETQTVNITPQSQTRETVTAHTEDNTYDKMYRRCSQDTVDSGVRSTRIRQLSRSIDTGV